MENVTGTLHLTREPNSRNGNPRYRCVIATPEDGLVGFYTRPDSSLAYTLPNYRGKPVTVSLSMYRGRLSLDRIAHAD